jgi:hypothetical protein
VQRISTRFLTATLYLPRLLAADDLFFYKDGVT